MESLCSVTVARPVWCRPVSRPMSAYCATIPCLAHVIQLVVKAILNAFNIKPAEPEGESEGEGKGVDEDVNGRSVNSAITKVWC